MIEIKNLTKKYNKKVVLEVQELKINQGERVAFVGRNGAGKTTLSEILMGTIKPTTGEIKIQNDNLRKNAVFQLTSYGNENNILDIAKMYFDLFKSKLDLNHLFTQFELDEQKKSKFSKMSGGQQQKFKFLIALLNDPNLLLLDELTTSLDFVWRTKIIGLLKQSIDQSDATVLLVSHDKEEIAHLCNRIIYLENGKITKDILLPQEFKEKVNFIESELMNYETTI